MDPTWVFLLTLGALHVGEGVYRVRREALAFREAGGAPLRGERAPGTLHHAFYLLTPISPLTALFIVELAPWMDATRRVRALENWFETPDDPSEGPVAPEPLEPQVEQTAVVGRRGFVVPLSSPALAHGLVATLREHEGKPLRQVVRRVSRFTHDTQAIRSRLADFRKATRLLGVLVEIYPWVLLGGAYAFFFVPWFTAKWRVWLVGLVALGVLIVVLFYRAHRRLYPALKGARAFRMLLLIVSPPARTRARQWLARDLLATFHPLPVGAVLLSPDDFRTWAGEVWRKLHFPTGVERNDELDGARAELAAAHRKVIQAAGLDPDTFLEPPSPPSPDAVAYCPRCQSTYVHVEGDCADCRGVRRVPFPSPPRA